jgi:hypothetical protein
MENQLHGIKGCENVTRKSRTNGMGKGGMSVGTAGVNVPTGCFKMLHKEARAAAGATAVQQKSTWLEFSQKSIP